MDRLYSAYSEAPGQKADRAVGDTLDRIFGTIEDPKKFDGKKSQRQGPSEPRQR